MRITALAASAVVLALVACGDTTAPRIPSATGTWTLQSVDGATLPANIPLDSGAAAVEVLGSTLTIGTDGQFTERITAQERAAEGVYVLDYFVRGSWTQQGTQVTFAAGPTSYPAVVGEQSLAYTYDNRTWTFVRRSTQ